jgi:flagellar protein FliO/FliZ
MHATSRVLLCAPVTMLTLALFAPGVAVSATLIADTNMEGYFRMIWGLLIVLGILLLLYALLKKRFSLLGNDGRRDIQIVEIRPLMGKKALCLVTVKGQELLLGLSGDRITHLATLNPGGGRSFQAVLDKTEAGSP